MSTSLLDQIDSQSEQLSREEQLELARRLLNRSLAAPEEDGPRALNETLEEWLARHREDKSSYPSLAEYRRALGISDDLEPMTVEAAREMMLAEGVRPEERLLSSEIIRMREE